jgi:hypothetical protein
MADDEDGLTALLGRALPPSLRRREVVIRPGQPYIVDESEWAGALVVVENGVVEVETAAGSRARFGPGAVLAFAGLGARVLRGCTENGEPAVLVAVSRVPGPRDGAAARDT